MLRKNLTEFFFSIKDKMLFVNSIQKPELLGYWHHFLIAVYVGCMGSSTKGGKNCVVVGNIHVLFNPKRGDVKLGQVLDLNSGSLFINVRHWKEMETDNIYAKIW
jgi:hypothetical protein